MGYFRMKSHCRERALMPCDWDPHRKWKFWHRNTWVRQESSSRQKILCSQWGPEKTSGWVRSSVAEEVPREHDWLKQAAQELMCVCGGAACLRDWCSEHSHEGIREEGQDKTQQRRGQETGGPGQWPGGHRRETLETTVATAASVLCFSIAWPGMCIELRVWLSSSAPGLRQGDVIFWEALLHEVRTWKKARLCHHLSMKDSPSRLIITLNIQLQQLSMYKVSVKNALNYSPEQSQRLG